MKEFLKTVLLISLFLACGKKPIKKVDEKSNAKSLSSKIFLQDRVFFDFDSYELNEQALKTVKEQASFLKSQKYIDTLVIEGHADERGTAEYNLILSKRRANSLASELKKHGFKGHIRVIAYGKERPEISHASTESHHAFNRRAVIG
jgi:peptidoglycan-associated lipoprotein